MLARISAGSSSEPSNRADKQLGVLHAGNNYVDVNKLFGESILGRIR